MLNQARLKQILFYDAESGEFAWRLATGRKVVVGTRAGGIGPAGYVVIGIDGKTYRGHRLAALWMTGEWPSGPIDHIDRNRANNAWHNLRPTDHFRNGHNHGLSRRNTSGLSGVSIHRQSGRWRAQISINRQHRHLGLFDTPEAAHVAYLTAKKDVPPCH